MNILVITNNPQRASFRQRIGIYLGTLRTNGINCKVVKLPAGSLTRRKLFKQAADFDGVFLHKKKLNFFDGFWLRKYSKKIIYDFDDAVMYSDKNPDTPSRKRQKSFQRTVELADMIIAGNSYLAEHARKFNPNIMVVPTGLDADAYKPKVNWKSDDKIRLVWIGSSSTLKYLAEIKPALEKIGSCFDNVILRIIADDFFELENMEVEKRSWSKQTEISELITSDIGLAPLPDNRFTRGKCSFKILQYFSGALPVVASPVGTNSDYVRDSITGFFATDIDEWTDRITKLIENKPLRKKMGEEGLAQAKRFDVSLVGNQLLNLINECLHR